MTVYTDGTITLEQGSADVVGAGTAWDTSAIVGGVIYVEAEGGNSLPFATVNSDTSITAAIKWMGESGEYSYSLVRDTVSGRQNARSAQLLSEVMQELSSPSLSAIAGVTASAQKLVLFTSPSSATTIDLADLIKGVEFDLTVADIDELEALTDIETGKRVLVLDAADGRSALYTRLEGEWSAPAFITGPQGAVGPYKNIIMGDITTLDPGEPATAELVDVDAETARLNLGLPKGFDGLNGDGAGDVVGPSSAVVGRVAIFNNASGTRLADSGVVLGDAASKNVGMASGNVAAGDDPRFGAAGKNDALFALEIADLKGQRLGMLGGIADSFDDETGVNLKTNAVYDAASDLYRPSSFAGDAQTATHTGATSGGNTVSAFPADGSIFQGWRAFDKLSGNADTWVPATGNPAYTTGWLQYQFASAKIVGSYKIVYHGDAVARAPKNWTLSGSNTGVFGGEQVLLDTRTNEAGWEINEARMYQIAVSQSFAYYRLNFTANNGANILQVGEVEYYAVGDTNNMTLQSVNYAAISQPTTGRIAIQTVETVAIAVNTDLVARISRDGGATWVTAALSLSQSIVGPEIYEATGISLMALGTGTSMKWEVSTANNKNIAVSGVVLQWS